MTTSRKMSFSLNLEEQEGAFKAPTRAYVQERLIYEMYDFIVGKFLEKESAEGLTRAELSRRTGMAPSIITRLLSAPRNIQLSTVANFLWGIAQEELTPTSRTQDRSAKKNATARDILMSPATAAESISANASTNMQAFSPTGSTTGQTSIAIQRVRNGVAC